MPRAKVQISDITAAIATALNGSTIKSGTLKAVADGCEVKVLAHSDAPNASYNDTFCIRVH